MWRRSPPARRNSNRPRIQWTVPPSTSPRSTRTRSRHPSRKRRCWPARARSRAHPSLARHANPGYQQQVVAKHQQQRQDHTHGFAAALRGKAERNSYQSQHQTGGRQSQPPGQLDASPEASVIAQGPRQQFTGVLPGKTLGLQLGGPFQGHGDVALLEAGNQIFFPGSGWTS